MNNNLDEVTLIDSDNNIISSMDKYEAHKHPAKLHRAISVWLINSKGEILLQKRSSKKIVGAGWWGNAICGNVRPTETFYECAVRRLREEIGVSVESLSSIKNLKPKINIKTYDAKNDKKIFEESINLKLKSIYKFEYKAYCNSKYGEHELDQVYVGFFDEKENKMNLNLDEVSEISWVNLDSLIEQIKIDKNIPNPDQTLVMSFEELKNRTAPYELVVNNKVYLLAPWTCMMLKDERFLREIIFA